MRTIDVSMPLFAGMPAFPGDPPFASEAASRLERGDPYDLSRITMGSHAGTHVDPPSHFLPGARSAEALDLDVLNGPCEVFRVRGGGRLITAAMLSEVPAGTRRLLLRTENSERWARRLEFFEEYVHLGLDGAKALLKAGVRLVGIDSLSIESDPSGRFPVHRELLGHGALILEGLLLASAEPGAYELRCLPLALRGGDGGPARAVLASR